VVHNSCLISLYWIPLHARRNLCCKAQQDFQCTLDNRNLCACELRLSGHSCLRYSLNSWILPSLDSLLEDRSNNDALVRWSDGVFIWRFGYFRLCRIFTQACSNRYFYAFLVAAMYLTAVVLQGYFNCDVFNIYTAFLGFQILFYIGMDVRVNPIFSLKILNAFRCIKIIFLYQIHLRFVDKKLGLKPPRSYLPPPVMRIFHVNAPVILIFFSLMRL